MAYLVLSLAFLAGFLLIFGVNWLLVDVTEARRRQVRKRLEEEHRLRVREHARGSMAYQELYEMAADGLIDLRERQSMVSRLLKLIHESGASLQPGQVIGLCLGAAALCGTLAGVLSKSIALAVLVGLVAGVAPLVYLSILRARRAEKLLSQLPDAFDVMSRTMRAGQTISQALQAVAEEFSSPIAEEFGYCYDQQNLGLSPEAAMKELARRTGLLELKIFVLAVMVHRQTGGNLSELFDKLAEVIRARYRIRGKIKALTAEGKMQGIILLALPVFMMFVIFMLNRPYIMTLFQYPLLLAGMFFFMAVGAVWMHKIVNFDF